MSYQSILNKIPQGKSYEKSPYLDRDEEAFFKFLHAKPTKSNKKKNV